MISAESEEPARPRRLQLRWALIGIAVPAASGTAFLTWQRVALRALTVTSGKFPEELVYVLSTDDVMNGGAMFTASKTSAKSIAVIWIHGWGTNFYSPAYVMIGRALAARGFTTISANTRMHDLGNSLKYRYGKRIRGGGYWGVLVPISAGKLAAPCLGTIVAPPVRQHYVREDQSRTMRTTPRSQIGIWNKSHSYGEQIVVCAGCTTFQLHRSR